MAIEVRIPTILRGYTDGAKSVEGSGSTLGELIADLEAHYGGLRDRLMDEGGLRRFVNVYLNDEDVRFLGGLETPVSDGDTVTVLPAVAGGRDLAAAFAGPGLADEVEVSTGTAGRDLAAASAGRSRFDAAGVPRALAGASAGGQPAR